MNETQMLNSGKKGFQFCGCQKLENKLVIDHLIFSGVISLYQQHIMTLFAGQV
jgi:hypothetical protein